ncbi:hypothetical protein ACYSNU_08685 [Enterococcus sp. LJL120]
MQKGRRKIFLVFFIFSVLYVLPAFDWQHLQLVILRGDDYAFHFGRIFSLLEQLKANGWQQEVAVFGHSQIFYGVNLFYPPLTSVVPIAILSALFYSVVTGLYLYVILLTFITFLIAYYTACYLTKQALPNLNRQARLFVPYIFSLLYGFSHYRLICFYERMALGEFVALSFYPLIFAGFYSILKDNGRKKHWLVLGMALLAYTHILSLILVSLVLGLMLIFYGCKKQVNKKIISNFIQVALLAGLLSLASLVPMVYQMLTIGINSVKTYDLQQQAYNLWTILANSLDNYLGYMSFGLVISVILGGCLWSYFRSPTNILRQSSFLKNCFGWSLVFLISLTTLFPWQFFQNTPMILMQFPFRLMPFLGIFSYYLGAVLLSDWLVKRHSAKRRLPVLLATLLAVLAIVSVENLIQIRDPANLMLSQKQVEESQHYQEYQNRDYLPKGLNQTEKKNILNKVGFINQRETVMDYQGNASGIELDLTLTASENRVVTPVIAYSGLVVIDQHQQKVKTVVSDGKTISFDLPAGQYQLQVSYQKPWLHKASEAITAFTLVGYSFYLVRKRPKENS